MATQRMTSGTIQPPPQPQHNHHEKKVDPTDPPLESLFNYGRIKRPITAAHLLFLLYVPFGVGVLFPLRAISYALCLLVALLLPRKVADPLTTRWMRFTCGIFTKYHHRKNLQAPGTPGAAKVLVCNHVTDFDPYPLWFTFPMFHILVAGHIRNVPLVGAVYQKFNTIFVRQDNRDLVRQEVKAVLEKSRYPVLVYPEGGLTNGRVGSMMYHKFVFSLGEKVQPVALKLSDPWPIFHDYIGSSWAKNWFWFLAVPYHVFELSFLEPQALRDGESEVEFSERVQQMTAEHLGLKGTCHAYNDKKALAKKVIRMKK